MFLYHESKKASLFPEIWFLSESFYSISSSISISLPSPRLALEKIRLLVFLKRHSEFHKYI